MTRLRGFSILELLISTSLFIIAISAALPLLIVTDRARSSGPGDAAWVAVALNALGQDVREATRLSIVPGEIRLQPAAGAPRSWRQEETALVRFVDGHRDQSLPGVRARFSAGPGKQVSMVLSGGDGSVKAQAVFVPRNTPGTVGGAR
ncbi:MAG: hypothetical protein AB7W28_03080 [Armatimonadota bacterium]